MEAVESRVGHFISVNDVVAESQNETKLNTTAKKLHKIQLSYHTPKHLEKLD